MTLNIQLPSGIEDAVRERALASGVDIETYIINMVKEDVLYEIPSLPKRRMSHEEFRARLDRIIQSHGISNGHFDDSRDSIYAGRGE